MITVVGFRTGDGRYCVPVEATVAVRAAAGLIPLPSPLPGVVGVLAGDEPLSVLGVLGRGSHHVLILAAGGRTFGLLVEEVTGLRRVEDDQIGASPAGQSDALIVGVISGSDGPVLLVDPGALAGRLSA